MNRILTRWDTGLTVVVAALAGTLLWAAGAHSQSLTAQTSATNSSPQNEIKLLRQELTVLTGRVQELEKKAGNAKNNTDDRRLVAIESTQSTLQAELSGLKTAQTSNAVGSHVQAPFIVYADGKVIFRVGRGGPSNTPEAVLGDEAGSHILLAARNTAAMALFYNPKDKGNTPGLEIVNVDDASYVNLHKGDNRAQLGSVSEGDFGVELSHGGLIKASLVTRRESSAGKLTLMNAPGDIVVEAGSLLTNVGIVRTGPKCCKPPGAIGPHQYIVGRTK